MRALRHAFAVVLTASMLIVPIGAAHADDGDGSNATTEATTSSTPSDTVSTDDSTDSTPPADPSAEGSDDNGTSDDTTTDSTPPAGDSDEGSVDEKASGDDKGTTDEGSSDEGTADEKSGDQGTTDSTGDQSNLTFPRAFSAQSLDVGILSICGDEACDDTYTATEGIPLVVSSADGVHNNDDRTPAIFIPINVNHGLVTPTGNGGFIFTPEPGYDGVASFDYFYIYGFLQFSNTATVTINIPNSPPQTAHDDIYYVEAGDTLTVNGPGVFDNDDSQLHIAFDVEDGVDHGSFSQLSSFFGGFEYTPDTGFTGTDTFTYHYYHLPTLSASSTATVTIVVYEEPTLSDDYYTTDMDTALTVPADGVLDNDSGGPVTSLTAFDEYGGTVDQINSDGSFTFTPDPGYYGWAGFQYEAGYGDPADGLVSDSAWVDIWVEDTRLPTIVDDTYTVTQGQTLHVPAPGPMGNDTFPDGTDWEIANCTQPAHATVTCAPDGALTVVPDEGFSGPLTFTYDVQKKVVILTSTGGAVGPAATHVGTTGSITVNVVVPAAVVDDEPDDTALLPDTGAPVNPWTLIVAAAMVVAGAGLVLRPRRRS